MCISLTVESLRVSECTDLIAWLASCEKIGYAQWSLGSIFTVIVGETVPIKIETLGQHLTVLNRSGSGSGPSMSRKLWFRFSFFLRLFFLVTLQHVVSFASDKKSQLERLVTFSLGLDSFTFEMKLNFLNTFFQVASIFFYVRITNSEVYDYQPHKCTTHIWPSTSVEQNNLKNSKASPAKTAVTW